MTQDNTRQTLIDGIVIEERYEPYTPTAVAPAASAVATIPPRPSYPAF